MTEANQAERYVLETVYGNSDFTLDGLNAVREITIRTGALTYSQQMTMALLEKGLSQVKLITHNTEHQQTLESVGQFICERQK